MNEWVIFVCVCIAVIGFFLEAIILFFWLLGPPGALYGGQHVRKVYVDDSRFEPWACRQQLCAA